jgi:hypothetical protein
MKYLKAEDDLAQAEKELEILVKDEFPTGKGLFDSTKVVGYGQVVIDKSELITLQHELQDLKKEIESSDKYDLVKERDEKIKELEEKIDKTELSGVNAPPCILSDGNQTLFELSFLPDTIYSMTFRNLIKPKTVGDWTLKNGETLELKHSEFKQMARILVDEKRINQNEEECCCLTDKRLHMKYLSSAYCLECMYVFKRNKDQEFGGEGTGWLGRFKKGIGEELVLFMHDAAIFLFLQTK